MEENKVVTLEDGLVYIVLDEISFNNKKFVYLCNNEDQSKFVIRKEILQNDNVYLQGLNDEVEFNEAITLFKNKNV